MAVKTGVASDHIDLWEKLIEFLTEDPTLVANGENWQIAWQAPPGAPNESDIVLKGPGSTGNEEIFVGMRRYAYPATNSYFIRMVGMTGILATSSAYNDHVNVSNNVVMYTDINPMSYWFVANGRRFVVVVKISTVYEAMYGGFFLPFGDPLSYPYPLMVGGSAGAGFGQDQNYTFTGSAHSHFVNPYGQGSISGDPGTDPPLYFLDPSAQWLEVDNGNRGATKGNNAVAPWEPLGGMGTSFNTGSSYPGSYYNILDNTVECLGGGFVLAPAMIVQNNPTNQTWGAMDGVYWVPSVNNAVENIVTVGGVDHLVVQNVYRTASHWCLALE